jgi:hypothetical protein
MDEGTRMVLSDPTGQIERECAIPEITQKSVALTYALAMRDEAIVPVDWKRANAAILKRWPKGLVRVKEAAWKKLEKMRKNAG